MIVPDRIVFGVMRRGCPTPGAGAPALGRPPAPGTEASRGGTDAATVGVPPAASAPDTTVAPPAAPASLAAAAPPAVTPPAGVPPVGAEPIGRSPDPASPLPWAATWDSGAGSGWGSTRYFL